MMPDAQTTSAPVPELLAPAGDWSCLKAAIENGADAVYFGLDSGFNARARATNFSVSDLPEIMRQLHERCVRGYVTLNTLAFTDELPRIEEAGRMLAEAGVDAVLVQDPGVARLLKRLCPELTLHASTQMTLTSAECIAVAQDLGLERVVLPRELSVDEIRKVHASTSMDLEAFVHGALCVAYSGQCLTSESLGGRSANRGQCAQACRLPYDLICDGQTVETGDQKYLLSPQDLAAYDLTADLISAGICSFKIEGRLKTPEYVANTVQHYRRAIDAAMNGRPAEFSSQQVNDLEMSFSRGFSPGWLDGCDHKMLVPATSSSKRGVLIGDVRRIQVDRVTVQLHAGVARGDGIVFEGDREHGEEQGGRVFEIFLPNGQSVESAEHGLVDLAFGHRSIDVDRLRSGLKIWKTDDPQLNRRLRSTFETSDVRRRVPVDIRLTAVTGQPVELTATAENGQRCTFVSDVVPEVARKHELTVDILREQLGRLGATIFQLRDVQATIEGSPMIPLSVLGQLRRRMIESLQASEVRHPKRQVTVGPVLPLLRSELSDSAARASSVTKAEPQLRILCRSRTQLQNVIDSGIPTGTEVYVDFADIREYGPAVQSGDRANVCVIPATPRIQKPGEIGIFQAMLKHQPRKVLIRNLAGLDFFRRNGVPVIADFSLNVTNELTADYLMTHGAERVTASYDMNRDQLLELVRVMPSSWLEVVIHQHMPMFHMEHCVFCSMLSLGTNSTNCGRPCDVHSVQLRDRTGMEHQLTADVGCRNTLFNAVPQSAAEVVPELLRCGIRSFRVEFLTDDEGRIRETIQL
ncbi:MAG: U32 family peptidase, partial [Planctomycetaceae bacterium]|nr:U32 family peptidase [Planctomycetaceae bacterium]